jgi:hypothetical protein
MRYYLWIEGKESGPYDQTEVQQAIGDGTIAVKTLARTESGTEWKPLSQILPQSRNADPVATKSAASKSVASSKHEERTESQFIGGFTRSQGTCVIVLLCIGLILAGWKVLKPVPHWEYKKLVCLTDGLHDRTGIGALSYSSIKLDESLLSVMGAEGWELTTSYLEMETAFPNFGKEEYVNGLQPNIRPQSLVLIFKRPK